MTDKKRRALLKTLGAAPVAALVASPARAATFDVAIENFKFSPDKLTIAGGDIVRFTNLDSAPHTATADNGTFDTGTLQKGQSAEIEIEPGGTGYTCRFHPNMKGRIDAI